MDDKSKADRVAELEADNRRLRRLLEQRDAPAELRHRLRHTLAVLRAIIRRSADKKRDLNSYVGHLEDRLDAVVRAQAAADEHGAIDLHTVLADELLHYGVLEGQRALISGPELELKPRAGQVLALAIHELAVNAVEHGALGSNDGRVEIAWSVSLPSPEILLTFTWKEFDTNSVGEPLRDGFGTEVLVRMLAHELAAETSLLFQPTGIRCVIRLPLTARIGRVAGGSEPKIE
jgi:two-component sensor histidine kinase